MAKIVLNITECSQCPFIKKEVVHTEDSFSRDENWICTKTKRKNNIIANWVHWTEHPDVPIWCPILLKTKSKCFS